LIDGRSDSYGRIGDTRNGRQAAIKEDRQEAEDALGAAGGAKRAAVRIEQSFVRQKFSRFARVPGTECDLVVNGC